MLLASPRSKLDTKIHLAGDGFKCLLTIMWPVGYTLLCFCVDEFLTLVATGATCSENQNVTTHTAQLAVLSDAMVAIFGGCMVVDVTTVGVDHP